MTVLLASEASGQSWDLWKGDDVELDVSAREGLRLELDDLDVELAIGGRVHWDSAWFQQDLSPIDHHTETRRGRLYLKGSILDDWSFKIEREFAGPGESWKNLWIGYEPMKNLELRAGNFIVPYCLEEVSSSNYSTFLERALPSAFAPSYQTGFGIQTGGRLGRDREENLWSWTTAAYMQPLGKFEDDPHGTEHWGVASRVTFAPLAEKRRVVHLGAAVDYENIDQDSVHGDLYSISSHPEQHLAPTLLDTGNLADVDEVTSLDAEVATVIGPFSAQGEYAWSKLQRTAGRPDPAFHGWYLQASYVLTGEARRYGASSGTFQGVKPTRKWGAVEIALRYSTLDLDDETVSGGHAHDFTAGLNWYLRENLELMFNYINVDSSTGDNVDGVPGDHDDDDPQIFAFRALVFF